LYGFMARVAFLLRHKGAPDPTSGSDEEWQQFKRMAEEALLRNGVVQADAARIALRQGLALCRDARGVRYLLNMLLRDPRLMRGILIRHYYSQALCDLERPYLA